MRSDIFSVAPETLDFDPRIESSLIQHAEGMLGLRIGAIATKVGNLTEAGAINKGDFGRTVEMWFNLKSNHRQEPDFPEAEWEGGVGVELKTLPVKQLKKGRLNSKERTVVTMIDFQALADEDWQHATVMNKMRRIIFFCYLHNYEDKANGKVVGVFPWSPPVEDFPQFEMDWKATQAAVINGIPEIISESLGRYLGACTKGSRDPKHRLLPNDKEAHPRAWALKAAYTWTQVTNHLDEGTFVSGATVLATHDPVLNLDSQTIVARTGQTRLERIEQAVLKILHGFEDSTIAKAYEVKKIPVHGGGKAMAARLMNGVIGIGENQDVLELAATGLRAKTMHFRKPGVALRKK